MVAPAVGGLAGMEECAWLMIHITNAPAHQDTLGKTVKLSKIQVVKVEWSG